MKKTWLRKFGFLTQLIFLSSLLSCVGTIENQNPDATKSVIMKTVKLSFKGVNSCSAISQSRVDIKFLPATLASGTASVADFSYQVYQNGNYSQPVASMKTDSIYVDPEGYYHIIVDGLNLNTTYSFSVRVLEPKSNTFDDNSSSCAIRTMNEKVPNFNGILDVEQIPGIEGQTALNLKWNPAIPASFVVGSIPQAGYEIKSYDIFWSSSSGKVKAEDLTLLTTLQEGNPQKTSYKVTNLVPGGVYYFMIRAKDGSGRTELNTQVLKGTTPKPTEGDLTFDGINTATVPTNYAGYSSVNVGWLTARGYFDRYLVYAIPETSAALFALENVNPEDDGVNSYLKATITNLALKSTSLGGLAMKTRYKIFVVACTLDPILNKCKLTASKGNTKSLVVETVPPLAPFGGITSISAPEGSRGLSAVYLNWNAPSTNMGVCSSIDILDSSTGNAIPKCSTNPTVVCLEDTPLCNSSKILVNNLQLNQAKCFKARVRDGTSRVQTEGLMEACGSVVFEKPGFQGFTESASCTPAQGGQSVQLTWTTPNPTGVYSNFIVVTKKGDDLASPSGAAIWDEAKSLFASSVMNSNGYQLTTTSNLSTSATITGLKPGTVYYFMVKTYIASGGEYFYDDNTNLITCTTDDVKVKTNGWEHIMSIGPRINGMMDSFPTATSDFDWDRWDKGGMVTYPPRGIMKETLQKETVGSSEHYYPRVIKTSGDLAPSAEVSREGIVQLAWKEFKVPQGSGYITLSEYLQTMAVDPSDGYVVLRREAPIGSTDSDIISQVNGMAGWSVVSTTPIQLNNKGVGVFTDYPQGVHPLYSADLNDTQAFRESANTGKVIWYTVRYRLGGKFLNFTTDNMDSKDAIVPVILPPANMAAIHHWMANKYTCELMGKTPKRSENYRCAYGGLGATLSGTDYYYDVGGHVLIDRFELGCNITRYNEAAKCKNSGTANDYDRYLWGVDQSTAGDCFGGSQAYIEWNGIHYDWWGYDQYFPSGIKGESVLYNHGYRSCMLKTSDASGNESDGWSSLTGPVENYAYTGSSAWYENSSRLNISQRVRANVPLATDNAIQKAQKSGFYEPADKTIIPPYINPQEVLGLPYVQNAPGATDPKTLRGFGARLSSNDSNLPPIVDVTPSQSYYLCQSHTIRLKTGNIVDQYVRKRLLSSRENFLASAPGAFINSDDTGNGGSHLDRLERASIVNQNIEMNGDKSNGNYVNSSTCMTSVNTRPGDNWNLTSGLYSTDFISTGNFSKMGTQRCVSRYGVQDYIGTNSIFLQDSALCLPDASGGICEVLPTDGDQKREQYETYFGTQETAKWPPFEFNDKEIYQNGLGNRFFWQMQEDRKDEDHFGYPRFVQNPWNATVAYGLKTFTGVYARKFQDYNFSYVIGQPLLCVDGQNFCHSDDKTVLKPTKYPTSAWQFLAGAMFQIDQVPLDGSGNPWVWPGTTISLQPHVLTTKAKGGREPYNLWWASWWDSWYVPSNNALDSNNYWSVAPYANYGNSTVVDWIYPPKVVHRAGNTWKNSTITHSTGIGVRCAVKVKLDPGGNIVEVDGKDRSGL